MTSILSHGTFKLTELSAAIEKLDESVRLFERRKIPQASARRWMTKLNQEYFNKCVQTACGITFT